jgi:hypothetical protein
MFSNSGQADFLKQHLIKIQQLTNTAKSQLLLEFGKYQTDANFEYLCEMVKIMSAFSKFESELLGKFLVFLQNDARYDLIQIQQDLETVQRRIETFIYTIRTGPAKDQFINVKPLGDYEL